MHAEESKRRTIQKVDIALSVSKNEMYDFLIDIVPREVDINKLTERDINVEKYTQHQHQHQNQYQQQEMLNYQPYMYHHPGLNNNSKEQEYFAFQQQQSEHLQFQEHLQSLNHFQASELTLNQNSSTEFSEKDTKEETFSNNMDDYE